MARAERLTTNITNTTALTRVSTSEENQGIVIKHRGFHQILSDDKDIEVEETKQSIVKFLRKPEHNTWINQIIETSEEIDDLLQQFREGRWIGVSDGSFLRLF